MDQAEKRICKGCLLKDLAPEEYLEHMKAYLNGLTQDIRAEEPLYLERLSMCENNFENANIILKNPRINFIGNSSCASSFNFSHLRPTRSGMLRSAKNAII